MKELEPKTRRFKEDDYSEVKKLWEITGLDRPEREDDLKKIVSSIEIGGELLILELGKHGIAGTSWMTFDGRRIHLHHFGIHPDFQGRGFSKILLKDSLDFAENKNIQIKLEVHRNNLKAISLYKNFGFEYLGDYHIYILRDFKNIRSGSGKNN